MWLYSLIGYISLCSYTYNIQYSLIGYISLCGYTASLDTSVFVVILKLHLVLSLCRDTHILVPSLFGFTAANVSESSWLHRYISYQSLWLYSNIGSDVWLYSNISSDVWLYSNIGSDVWLYSNIGLDVWLYRNIGSDV